MLAGLSTLLPAERVDIPSTDTGNNILDAAKDFHAIATHPPQPATLPAPLTRQEKLVSGAFKAGILIVLVAIITLPLLRVVQKDNADVNALTPWTEPSNEYSDVLDSQRRQLISEQLGIIDLQQPDSVALVSFDYNSGSSGEMQPLAEAVLGRLKGQGMRLIATSLDPQGALIAQQTLEEILEERDEGYGDIVVNLGYIPGQVAGVRALVTGPDILAAIPDFQENLPLTAREGWQDISNIGQVDVVVTFADNPTTARWWVEQIEAGLPPETGERYLLAATSAAAQPFLNPYRESEQLDGLISGVTGAAALEAGRKNFGPARQMIDSLSIASLIIVIVIAAGTIIGWMKVSAEQTVPTSEPVEETAIPEDEQEET